MLVGSDAVGRLAVGQEPPVSSTNAYLIPITAGTYTLTGKAQGFGAAVSVTQGSYTLTGNPQSLGTSISVTKGSYSLTGFTTTYPLTISVTQGSYALTGKTQSLGSAIGIIKGSYALTGFTTSYPLTIPITAGSYSLVGTNTPIGASIGLTFGSYTLTGYPSIGTKVAGLLASTGNYLLTGFAQNILKQVPKISPQINTWSLWSTSRRPSGRRTRIRSFTT